MSYSILVTILVVITASSGGIFKPGAWYEGLKKPSWTPPGWMFPVVWLLLYVMIAVAGWLILQRQGWSWIALIWFLQLILNAAWSWLFFGLRRMDIAFGDVCLLWISIVVFIVLAWPVSQAASLLMVPYLVWVSIAGLLNYRVWQMNPGAA